MGAAEGDSGHYALAINKNVIKNVDHFSLLVVSSKQQSTFLPEVGSNEVQTLCSIFFWKVDF